MARKPAKKRPKKVVPDKAPAEKPKAEATPKTPPPTTPDKLTKAEPPAKRPGRPRTDPALIAIGMDALRQGHTLKEAALISGVSKSVLDRALKEEGLDMRTMRALVREAQGPEEDHDNAIEIEFDEDASSLDIARALFDQQRKIISKLKKDSPRMNPAHQNARAYLALISRLEREQAGKETPEQALERKRREDGETRKAIERYVLEYEAQAERDGVCLHCGQSLGGAARVDHRAQALADVLPALKAIWDLSTPEGRRRFVTEGARAISQLVGVTEEWPEEIRRMVATS